MSASAYELRPAETVHEEIFELLHRVIKFEIRDGMLPDEQKITRRFKMPERWGGYLAIQAWPDRNSRQLRIIGATLEMQEGTILNIHGPTPKDDFTEPFVDVLQDFDSHDHEECLSEYTRGSFWLPPSARTNSKRGSASIDFIAPLLTPNDN
jgi:hypothetical protein